MFLNVELFFEETRLHEHTDDRVAFVKLTVGARCTSESVLGLFGAQMAVAHSFH